MIHTTLMIGLLALLSPVTGGLAGQSSCREPTTNAWLRQGPVADPSGFMPIDESQVLNVSAGLEAATTLLMTADAVEITRLQARQFSGQSSLPGGTPYLVRAVFPNSHPAISVSWRGTDLYVFAGGLGCAPYEKRPIVVFLDRQPTQVFVSAAAAL